MTTEKKHYLPKTIGYKKCKILMAAGIGETGIIKKYRRRELNRPMKQKGDQAKKSITSIFFSQKKKLGRDTETKKSSKKSKSFRFSDFD